MTNRVDIEVTGTNKFDATQAAVVKNMLKIQAATDASAEAKKKLDSALATKPKLGGVTEAEKALERLADTAEKATARAKKSLDDGIEAMAAEREIKIKAKFDLDKDRFKSSLDGLDFGSVDMTRGLGPKIADALGKGVDMFSKGAGAVAGGVKTAASFAMGLSDGIKAQHPAVQAAIIGTLVLAAANVAPFVGGALAGGIIAGFGAGIAGLGIVVAAQNDRVRSQYRDLWEGITQDIKGRSSSIEDVLLRSAQRTQTAYDSIGATLERSFDKIAPGLESLLDGALRSIQRFAPALEPIAMAASAVFRDLGERLPGIVGELADEFGELAEEVRANPEAFTDFIAAAAEVAEIITDIVGGLNYLYGGWKKTIEALATPLEWVGLKDGEEAAGKTGSAMLKLSDIASSTPTKLQSLQASFKDLAEAENDAAKRGDAFLDIMDKLNGRVPSFEEAVQDANDTVRGLIDAFANGVKEGDGFGKALLNADGTINTMTKNGSLLYDAISGLRENFADMAGATRDLEAAGMSHEEAVAKVNGQIAVQSQRLLEAAGKMGLNQDQMRELLRLYGLTPKQIDTLMKLDDAKYRNDLANALQPRTLWIVPQLTSTGLGVGAPKLSGPNVAHAFGGNVAKAASGGARNDHVIINDGPGYPGEAVRLPNGSTVWPAGMTNMMMKQAARGAAMGAGGGGGGATTLEWIGPPDLIDWLKDNVRVRGGDPGVFG